MIIDNPNLFIAKIALIQDHKKYGLTLNIQLSYTKDNTILTVHEITCPFFFLLYASTN